MRRSKSLDDPGDSRVGSTDAIRQRRAGHCGANRIPEQRAHDIDYLTYPSDQTHIPGGASAEIVGVGLIL
jgi:hypothetical protein